MTPRENNPRVVIYYTRQPKGEPTREENKELLELLEKADKMEDIITLELEDGTTKKLSLSTALRSNSLKLR